ncbi:Vesicle-associated membrane protein 4 [Apodemus speciosus]|uniref:Vesicle-associated membrane protein 4 n=1 Tax=Apodemus speciosus TaxID=105296 RepID=A0ABQ0EFI1_APOSI
MPPKFKRHLNDDDVTGSVKSERRNLLEDDSDEEEDFFLRGPSGPRFGPRNDKIKQAFPNIPGCSKVTSIGYPVPPRGAVHFHLETRSFSLAFSKPGQAPCVQNQVDEVIDVMQENITKVIERGERLDELQDKSESLSDNATAFSNRSKQLRRQMWWRGCKIKAIMALAAAILLLMIIILIVVKFRT